ESSIYAYRRFLEPSLLVTNLRPGFDAVEKLVAMTPPWEPSAPDAPDPGDLFFSLYEFRFHVLDQAGRLEVQGVLETTSGDLGLMAFIGRNFLGDPDNFKNTNYTVLGQGTPAGQPPKWSELRNIRLFFKVPTGEHDVIFTTTINAIDQHGV